MAYDYDRLYRETPDALGPPNAQFSAFFSGLRSRPMHVLDVGCGQGRDALFIARLGHRVVGVDLSPHGIAALRASALEEGLAVEAHVADITQETPSGPFDIVLFDRTLHMLASADRLAVLGRALETVGPSGWVLIADERRNMPALKAVFEDHAADWQFRRDNGAELFAQRA